jgi:hypothetical protein
MYDLPQHNYYLYRAKRGEAWRVINYDNGKDRPEPS